MSYKTPIDDQLFVLRDVLELENYANLEGFSDAPLDVIEQILREGGRFAEEVLAPLNGVGDKQGCTWSQDNTVKTPDGFKEAYAQKVESGFPALTAKTQYGGQ